MSMVTLLTIVLRDRPATKCGGAQRLGGRHHPSPRDAVGEQARRDREQDERQRQCGLQQAGLAFADTEHVWRRFTFRHGRAWSGTSF